MKFIVLGTEDELVLTNEYSQIARILELTACHQEGIKVLANHLDRVIEFVDLFLRLPGEEDL